MSGGKVGLGWLEVKCAERRVMWREFSVVHGDCEVEQ